MGTFAILASALLRAHGAGVLGGHRRAGGARSCGWASCSSSTSWRSWWPPSRPTSSRFSPPSTSRSPSRTRSRREVRQLAGVRPLRIARWLKLVPAHTPIGANVKGGTSGALGRWLWSRRYRRGIGIGLAASGVAQGMARQPEVQGRLFTVFILGRPSSRPLPSSASSSASSSSSAVARFRVEASMKNTVTGCLRPRASPSASSSRRRRGARGGVGGRPRHPNPQVGGVRPPRSSPSSSILAVMAKLVWPPVLEMMEKRQQKIQDDLDAAERSKIEAAEEAKSYEAKILEAHHEADAIVAKAKKEAEEVRSAVLAKAQREAADIIAKAHGAVDLRAPQGHDRALRLRRGPLRGDREQDHRQRPLRGGAAQAGREVPRGGGNPR